MYKDLDEPIDLIVHFAKGTLKPLRFLWNGRSFKIARVTGIWKAPQGDKWVRHFSVVDSADNVFFMTYDERSMRWAIGKVGGWSRCWSVADFDDVQFSGRGTSLSYRG